MRGIKILLWFLVMSSRFNLSGAADPSGPVDTPCSLILEILNRSEPESFNVFVRFLNPEAFRILGARLRVAQWRSDQFSAKEIFSQPAP